MRPEESQTELEAHTAASRGGASEYAGRSAKGAGGLLIGCNRPSYCSNGISEAGNGSSNPTNAILSQSETTLERD